MPTCLICEARRLANIIASNESKSALRRERNEAAIEAQQAKKQLATLQKQCVRAEKK